RTFLQDVVLSRGVGFFVLVLDQQPILFLLLVRRTPHANEHRRSAQLLRVAAEMEQAACGPRTYAPAVATPATVRPAHRAASVLPVLDDPLERSVLHRMILDMHRQTLLPGIEARSLRNRPAQQDAAPLEAEIVVEARGRVLLDAVDPSGAPAPLL